MSLLTGSPLKERILKITRTGDVDCAVAFWGRGSEKIFENNLNGKIRIVCNLSMGGTNPEIISKFIQSDNIEVKQLDNLHAKVYVGEREAIVSSSNASINGLGLEGDDIGWIEAGSVISTSSGQAFFDKIWKKSRSIGDEDIKAALQKFKNRQSLGLSLAVRGEDVIKQKLREFVQDEEGFPTIEWYIDVENKLNRKNIADHFGITDKVSVDDACKLIESNGIQIETPEDEKILVKGRQILYWHMTLDGQPYKKLYLKWVCSSGICVKSAAKVDGKNKDFLLPLLDAQKPFDVKSSPKFVSLFKETIMKDEYSDLRDIDFWKKDNTFYTESRLGLMKKFWIDLYENYNL